MTISADTIYALATPPGVGGIAVIRISGPEAEVALTAMSRSELPAPRMAALRYLRDRDGRVIDEALVLRFSEGESFTGETVVELHCHGGRAVVSALLAELARFPSVRQAEPGEFTRRALLNGRLDLAEVEALGDLVAAETEMQRRQAIEALSGGVQSRIASWRERTLTALALIEATIDWADEEVPEDVTDEVVDLITRLEAEITLEVQGSIGRERLRQGFEVAVIGAPNSGKSSFINWLAGREAAITSPHPGTTRDVIELRYDLSGLPVTFLDTAGLRVTDDPVEGIGVARARERSMAADLRLLFVASDAESTEDARALLREGDVVVWTKLDLGSGPGDLAISTRDGRGIRELLEKIHSSLAARIPAEGLFSHARQRSALRDCLDGLRRAEAGILGGAAAEIVAADLRGALDNLDRLVGRRGVEDILGVVFQRFCLGK